MVAGGGGEGGGGGGGDVDLSTSRSRLCHCHDRGRSHGVCLELRWSDRCSRDLLRGQHCKDYIVMTSLLHNHDIVTIKPYPTIPPRYVNAQHK